MVTRSELDTLELWSGRPARTRLRAFIAASIAGEGHQEREAELARRCGYRRAIVVALWTSFRSHVPVQKLPILADFLGVDLAMLVCFWLAEMCHEDDEERIVEAVQPQYTSDELSIVETARECYSEEKLVADVRSGRLEE